jgi:hypothetical protein
MGGKNTQTNKSTSHYSMGEGKSRDKIAQELPISAGAVSSIVKDFRQDDPEFDLLVRVYEVLREKQLLAGITGQESLALMQERLEALMVDLEVF